LEEVVDEVDVEMLFEPAEMGVESMMCDSGAERTQRKEYRMGRWPTVLLVLGLMQIAMAVWGWIQLGGRTSSVRPTDSTLRRIVGASAPVRRHIWLFATTVGVFVSLYGAVHVRYRVVVDEDGVRLRSLLLDRRVAWNEVQWCLVWHKGMVVLGRPRGRALVVLAGMLWPRGKIVEEIVSRVRQTRVIRPRPVVFGGAFAFSLLGMLTVFKVTYLPWLVAAGAGGICGLVYAVTVPKRRGMDGVFAAAALVVAVLVAWGISSLLYSLTRWPTGWATLGLFSGWLYGFMLARMHEERIRGMPGADWTREVEPPVATRSQ